MKIVKDAKFLLTLALLLVQVGVLYVRVKLLRAVRIGLQSLIRVAERTGNSAILLAFGIIFVICLAIGMMGTARIIH